MRIIKGLCLALKRKRRRSGALKDKLLSKEGDTTGASRQDQTTPDGQSEDYVSPLNTALLKSFSNLTNRSRAFPQRENFTLSDFALRTRAELE